MQNSQELLGLRSLRFAIGRAHPGQLAAVDYLQAGDDSLVAHHRATLLQPRQRLLARVRAVSHPRERRRGPAPSSGSSSAPSTRSRRGHSRGVQAHPAGRRPPPQSLRKTSLRPRLPPPARRITLQVSREVGGWAFGQRAVGVSCGHGGVNNLLQWRRFRGTAFLPEGGWIF